METLFRPPAAATACTARGLGERIDVRCSTAWRRAGLSIPCARGTGPGLLSPSSSYDVRSVAAASGWCAACWIHGPRQISRSTPRTVMPLVPGMGFALASPLSGPLSARLGGGSVMRIKVYMDGVCRCDRVYVDVEKLWNDSVLL